MVLPHKFFDPDSCAETSSELQNTLGQSSTYKPESAPGMLSRSIRSIAVGFSYLLLEPTLELTASHKHRQTIQIVKG
jgi:hypothetical protein